MEVLQCRSLKEAKNPKVDFCRDTGNITHSYFITMGALNILQPLYVILSVNIYIYISIYKVKNIYIIFIYALAFSFYSNSPKQHKDLVRMWV